MGGGTFWGLGSILTKAKVYYMSILDPREYMVIYLCDRTRLLALHLQLSSRRLQFLEYESDSVLCEHFCIVSYNPIGPGIGIKIDFCEKAILVEMLLLVIDEL